MTHRTLLEIADAPLHPGSLSNATLVIVDAQNEYVSGQLPLTGVAAAIAQCRVLLDRARAAGTPVVHVVHAGRAGGMFDLAGPSGAIVDALSPAPGETVIEKSLPNSFAATTLAAELTKFGRKELIVVGFMTHMCVSSTVRAALDLNYRTTVVAAACATRPLPGIDGKSIAADVVHHVALAELADRFAIIARDVAAIPN